MQTEGTKPSWTTSLLVLAALGALFYSSYGLSNWLASRRADVPAVVFSWERKVPFVAWMIVPYWTTNIFYAASLFLCRTQAEFRSHVRRLLTAQVVAVFFFIILPLRFSWPKPDTSGPFNFLYASLAVFDKPFNQAPSLHVALTTVLASLYFRRLPVFWRIAFGLWSAVVVASVMTTYQHHFIDIPTGFLLGLFCIWLWPPDGSRRSAAWRPAHGWQAVLSLYYLAGAVSCAAAAAMMGGGFLWLLWPAVALGCVALAYMGLGAEVFDKHTDGSMGWPSRILMYPYLLAARANSRLWTRRESKAVQIAENVFLGRFPAAGDLAGFSSVIDLTCEFAKPPANVRWQCLPMLDLVAPEAAQLRAAADAIERERRSGPVLVACALGFGRSVAAIAAWLVCTGREPGAQSAIARLRQARPKLSLSKIHIQNLNEAAHELSKEAPRE